MKDTPYQKVIEHFKESEDYKRHKGLVHPEHDPIILDFFKKHASNDDKILEVGGGSGYMLDLITTITGSKFIYNCEIVPGAYKMQANENINLLGGDALNLPFKSNSFDFVLIKNLLHHLVGRTRKESKNNAKKAISEIKRVLHKDGYIILLEQYNNYKLFSSIIFYITTIGAMFKFRLKLLGWGKNVIVSFLTPEEIINLLIDSTNLDIVLSVNSRLNVSKIFRYTLLMSHIGRLLIIGKI